MSLMLEKLKILLFRRQGRRLCVPGTRSAPLVGRWAPTRHHVRRTRMDRHAHRCEAVNALLSTFFCLWLLSGRQ